MVTLVVVLTPNHAVDGNLAGIFTPFSHKVNGSGELALTGCWLSSVWCIDGCPDWSEATAFEYQYSVILSWNWAFKKDSSLKIVFKK